MGVGKNFSLVVLNGQNITVNVVTQPKINSSKNQKDSKVKKKKAY